MDTIRKNPLKKLGDYSIKRIRDYSTGKIVDIKTGKETETDLPTSNVLYYELNDDAWCCVRPSGTEPKIKFYMGVKGKSLSDAEKKLEKLKNAITKIAE